MLLLHMGVQSRVTKVRLVAVLALVISAVDVILGTTFAALVLAAHALGIAALFGVWPLSARLIVGNVGAIKISTT